MTSNEGKNTQREKISTQLIALSEETIKLASEIAARTEDRLATVMHEKNPSDKKEGVCAENWPSLFQGLRSNLWEIQKSLRDISSCIDRMEV